MPVLAIETAAPRAGRDRRGVTPGLRGSPPTARVIADRGVTPGPALPKSAPEREPPPRSGRSKDALTTLEKSGAVMRVFSPSNHDEYSERKPADRARIGDRGVTAGAVFLTSPPR